MTIIDGVSGINKISEKDNITIYSTNNNICTIAIKSSNITGNILPVIDINYNDYISNNLVNIDETNKIYNTLNNRADNTMLIIFNLDMNKLKNSINSKDDNYIINIINEVIDTLEKEIVNKGHSIYKSIFVLEKTDLDKQLTIKLKLVRPTMYIPYNKVVNNPNKEETTVNEQHINSIEPQPEQVQSNNSEEISKPKSKKLSKEGYVNIVLLTTILVGVTIFSIELGKYLYFMYG